MSAPASEEADAAAQRPVYLGNVERFRLEGRAAFPTVADFNADGRPDFVLVDLSQSLISAWYSRQDAEKKASEFRLENDGDWVWRERKLVVAEKGAALATGDFNNDGKMDLAVAYESGRAAIHSQGDDGLDEQPERLNETAKTLAAGDFNTDGLDDLLLAGDGAIVVMLQGPDGLKVAHRLTSSVDPQGRLLLQDMDRDGMKDLVFIDPSDRKMVVIRYAMSNGAFGPEHRHEIGDSLSLVGLGSGRLAALDPSTRAISVFSLQPPTRAGASGLKLGDGQILPFPADLAGSKVAFATLDSACHPGVTEAIFGMSKGAQLLRYHKSEEGGRLSFDKIPAYSGVTAVVSSGAEVFMLSGEEKILGRLNCDSLQEMEKFPTPVELDETPLAFAIGPFDAATPRALWVVYRPGGDEDEDLVLAAFAIAEDGSAGEKLGEAALDETFDFAPEKLVVGDANNDGLGDFILFFEFEDPILYFQKEGAEFAKMDASKGVERGLLAGVKAQQFALADYDADGQQEMLIARDGFLRASAFDAEGKLTVERQFNARSLTAKLVAPTLIDVDGDGLRDIVCVQDGDKLLAFLSADPNEPRLKSIAKLDARGASTGDFNGDSIEDLLVVGGRQVVLFAGGGRALDLVATTKRLTDVPNGMYGAIASGALFGEGEPMALVAIEARENMMEFLLSDDDGDLASLYRFKVFDHAGSFDDQQLRRFGAEPRETIVADVDGDGLNDVVSLAHQNVLIYRQLREKPAPSVVEEKK